MADKLLLSIDVGTGGVRVAAVTPDGKMLDSASVSVETYTPKPAHAEQNPQDWWDGLKAAIGKLLLNLPADAFAGIAVDGTSATVIPCDSSGNPLRPCLLWMDVRATKQAEKLTATGDPALKYAGMQTVSAEWGVPKLMWLAENEPDIYKKAEVFVDCVDWMNFKLTGEWAMSICTATLKYFYDSNWSGWPTTLYADAGISDALGKLPSNVLNMGELVGEVSQEAARELGIPAGIPVTMGGIDAPVGAIGLGVVEEGSLALITGSSHVLLGQTTHAIYAKGIWGAYYDAIIPGLYTVEAGQISSGSVNNWFTNGFTVDAHKRSREGGDLYKILDAKAKEIPIGCEGVVALDHFQGNRSPYCNPYSRGAFTGLTLSHTEAHLYRAVLESVCYGTKTVFDTFRDKGFDPVKVVVSGGPTKSKFWMQMHADVTGVPLLFPKNTEGPLMGGAILASIGAGLHKDIGSAANAMVEMDHVIEPNPDATSEYQFYHERYLEIYEALSPINSKVVRHVSGA